MNMLDQFFKLITIVIFLKTIVSYPYKYKCGKVLSVGQTIMGSTSISSSSSRMVVTRNGVTLSSGDTYVPGESLSVTVSGGGGDYLFQTNSNAKYSNGACSGLNAYSGSGLNGANVAILIVPSASGSGDVSIWAGFASIYGKVSIVSPFILKDPKVVGSPSTTSTTAVPISTTTPSCDGPFVGGWTYNYNLTEDGLSFMKWKINNINSIDISLTSNVNGVGWMGLGISEVGHMVGSDIFTVIYDEKTGSASVQDRWVPYAASNPDQKNPLYPSSLYPVLDIKQDWTLKCFSKTSRGMTAVVSRLLDTLDNQDRVIVNKTQPIIFAGGSTFGYHGPNSGHFSINLIDPPETNKFTVPTDATASKAAAFNPGWSLRPVETQYICQAIDMDPSADEQIVAFEPIYPNSAYNQYVHHVLIHGCGNSISTLNSKKVYSSQPWPCQTDLSNPSSINNEGSSVLGLNTCTQLLFADAAGGTFIQIPSNVGIKISSSEIRYIVVEVHLNNPSLQSGVLITDLYKLYTTTKLRKHNGGVLITGDPSVSLPSLQPGKSNIHYETTCTSGCTSQFKGPLNVYGSFPHTHIVGSKIWTSEVNSKGNNSVLNYRQFWNFNFQTTEEVNLVFTPGKQYNTHCVYDLSSTSHSVTFGVSKNGFKFCGYVGYNNQGYDICGGGIVPSSINMFSKNPIPDGDTENGPASVKSFGIVTYPTATPSAAPISGESSQDYPSSLATNLTVGLVVGFTGLAMFIAFLYLYISDYNASKEGNNFWLSSFFNFFREYPVVPIVAVSLGVASIALVSVWAQNGNSSSQQGYLGKPIWMNNANILSWHVVLMVSGFFFCQVVAICSWSLFPESMRTYSKLVHIFFQVCAVVTMAVGLAAVVNYKANLKQSALVSMHSWVGVAAISLFGINFLMGVFMSTLTKLSPESIFREAFDLGFIHRTIGSCAFNLTVASVLTGITNYLPWETCTYNTNGVDYNSPDVNPANNYGMIPTACRIANGLGVTVFICAVFVTFTSAIRSKYSTNNTVVTVGGKHQTLPQVTEEVVSKNDEDF